MSLECYIVCFDCMFKYLEFHQNKLKQMCWTLGFTLCKASLKNKKRPRTSLPNSFSAWFLKKNIYRAVFYQLTKSHCQMSLLLERLCNFCILIIRNLVCDVIHFEINGSFLTDPFFYITKKSVQKCKYLKNEKSF